jgi:hypothetical protein
MGGLWYVDILWLCPPLSISQDSVLSAPQILNIPLLLIANKQDSPQALSVEEIRHDYEDWHQRRMESARRNVRNGDGETERRERIASLDVMGISAIEGFVLVMLSSLNLTVFKDGRESSR